MSRTIYYLTRKWIIAIGLMIILSCQLPVLAQFPEPAWYKSYGWIYLDEGESLQQTSDGGFLIAGYTYRSLTGGADVYLIKTDSHGNLEWEKFYGGASDDWANCIRATHDGYYILAGGTGSFDVEGSDVYLLKVDENGELIWQRTFGGSLSEEALSVAPADDGGYIVAGHTTSFGAGSEDIYVVKTDDMGNPQWSKTFGGIYDDKAYAVQQTSDGGYIIGGGTNYFGIFPPDAILIKTSSTGDSLWTALLGGQQSDAGSAVIETFDSCYVLVGWTMSRGAGQHDVYVAKVNINGQLIWDETFGGDQTDIGRSVYQTFDGGFIIAGYSKSFGATDQDAYIIRLNFKGDSLWTDLAGGPDEDYAWDAIETADGGYAIAGWTRSFSRGSKDAFLIRYDGATTHSDSHAELNLPAKTRLNQNYPNPFNPSTTISYSLNKSCHVNLDVYDLLGRKVGTIIDSNQDAGNYRIVFDGSDLSSGVYIYRLQTDQAALSQQMILAK